MRKKIFKTYTFLWLLRRLEKVKLPEEWLEKLAEIFESVKEKIPVLEEVLEKVDLSFVGEYLGTLMDSFFSTYPFVKNILEGIYAFLGNPHSWIGMVLLYLITRIDKKGWDKIFGFCKSVKTTIEKHSCEAKLLKKTTNVERLTLEESVFLKVVDKEVNEEESRDMVLVKEWHYKGIKFFYNQGKVYFKVPTAKYPKVLSEDRETKIRVDGKVVAARLV